MPISLRALAADRQTLRIDYGEAGDLNITFTPSLVTEKLIRQIRAITADSDVDEMADAINATLLRLVESWDVTDDNGAVIPLTPDGMGDVPIMVRFDILNKLVDEMRLGEPKGTPSPKPSRKRS